MPRSLPQADNKRLRNELSDVRAENVRLRDGPGARQAAELMKLQQERHDRQMEVSGWGAQSCHRSATSNKTNDVARLVLHSPSAAKKTCFPSVDDALPIGFQ